MRRVQRTGNGAGKEDTVTLKMLLIKTLEQIFHLVFFMIVVMLYTYMVFPNLKTYKLNPTQKVPEMSY